MWQTCPLTRDHGAGPARPGPLRWYRTSTGNGGRRREPTSMTRTRLPIRRPPFQGVVMDTLDGSQPDWEHVAPIRAPEGAPNVLLVLTDDAGFGNPSASAARSGRRRSSGSRRRAQLQPLPHDGAVLADAGGADDRAQPSRRGLRHGRRVRRAVPRLHGDAAEGLPAVREDAAGQRLLDRLLRQVAPDAGLPAGLGGPFDRWPNAVGFDYFWGFLAASPASSTR
jgi:arylsulfatase